MTHTPNGARPAEPLVSPGKPNEPNWQARALKAEREVHESIEREDALRQRALERTVRAQAAERDLAEAVGVLRQEATPAMIAAGLMADPLGCDVANSEAAMVYGKIWRAMASEAAADLFSRLEQKGLVEP